MKRINNFNELLTLFGNQDAIDKFVLLCKQYRLEVQKQNIASSQENSNRAELHNKIMEMVAKLCLFHNYITPRRDEIKQMILQSSV